MKKSSLLLLLAAAAIGFSGCQSSKTAGMSVSVDMNQGQAKVIQADSGVAGKLAVLSAPSGYTSDHFLIAQVEIKGLKKRDFHFQYMFNWYDANGMEIYPGKGLWKAAVIHGEEIQNLQAVSPYSTATSFRISFRPIN